MRGLRRRPDTRRTCWILSTSLSKQATLTLNSSLVGLCARSPNSKKSFDVAAWTLLPSPSICQIHVRTSELNCKPLAKNALQTANPKNAAQECRRQSAATVSPAVRRCNYAELPMNSCHGRQVNLQSHLTGRMQDQTHASWLTGILLNEVFCNSGAWLIGLAPSATSTQPCRNSQLRSPSKGFRNGMGKIKLNNSRITLNE